MSNILNELYDVCEKSTQYYYFNDEMLNAINSNTKAYKWYSDWIYSSGPGNDDRYVPDNTPEDYIDSLRPTEVEEITKTFIKKKWINANEASNKTTTPTNKKSNAKYPIGTLVQLTNFGKDNEPQKNMWNGSLGEIRSHVGGSEYKIKITNIKGSDVLHSKKWMGREQKALEQRFSIQTGEFKTLQEIKAEEEAK